MKLNHLVTSLLVLILFFVLSGCAGMSTKNTSDLSCTTADIKGMLNSGDYQKKVDNFIILQDATSSMNGKLSKSSTSVPSKLTISKGLIRCLDNSLPEDFAVNGGMRIFGLLPSEKGLVYGMSWYSKAGLDNAILAIKGTGSKTDLSDAINDATNDLKQVTGKTAVIIFSDGGKSKDIDPVAAAAAMNELYGDNVCIYTVFLGDDPNGKMTLDQIAAQGECGFSTEANNLYMRPLAECDTVNVGKGMGDFVTSVFIKKAEIIKPAPVILKKCPDVPEGIEVDEDGCPIPMKENVSITLLVEFDFDKDEVLPLYHDDIEKVANILIADPKTNVELEGHTDSINTEEYNMNLSRRRSESVKKYLIEKFNIDTSRISTIGYGESNPVDTNETDEGRQKNRRVVANIEAVIDK